MAYTLRRVQAIAFPSAKNKSKSSILMSKYEQKR